jgi:uncharacterized protein (DUF488 family)
VTTVYTIGYEGTDISRFIETLKITGVEVLADVRAVAISRKPGFSKTALRTRLEAEGIAYRHFVDLGDPKPGREAARAGRHAEFQRIYTTHLAGTGPQEALQSLADVALQGATCLLCFERDPKGCHRTIIADRLKAHGMSVFDLYGDLPSRYERYGTKQPSGYSRQGAAAA